MPYKDKEKQKLYLAAHYQENKDKYKMAARSSKKRRRNLVIEAKNIPCTDCGIQYPHYVMQFDHIGEKNFTIANAVSYGGYGKIENLIDEISKCEVVCANCHAERTWKQRVATMRLDTRDTV